MTEEKATRRSNRIELTEHEARFVMKALESQIETLEAQADWPAIIPFSKQSVIESHQAVVEKIKQTAHFTTEVTPAATRAPRTKQKQANGATASAAS